MGVDGQNVIDIHDGSLSCWSWLRVFLDRRTGCYIGSWTLKINEILIHKVDTGVIVRGKVTPSSVE